MKGRMRSLLGPLAAVVITAGIGAGLLYLQYQQASGAQAALSRQVASLQATDQSLSQQNATLQAAAATDQTTITGLRAAVAQLSASQSNQNGQVTSLQQANTAMQARLQQVSADSSSGRSDFELFLAMLAGQSGFGSCRSLPSATGQELRECAFIEGDFDAIDRSANQ
jgi:hypothetical protein